eukprot:CAMPEP_0197443608 /NCGR_PEP_ID=MMETSP1175-20131217/9307_1 /TAXON_ID=1003142 /ORGANISM="Triceratium dubium, Strain CCMP147" /LENGTH=212 /DNA_ID=CAMNT_0042974269 /DNA_START=125 /DNA_END=763 /DNA_ORIENTATION=-
MAPSTTTAARKSGAKRAFAFAAIAATSALSAEAFVSTTSPSSSAATSSTTTTSLFAAERPSGRREMLSKSFGIAAGIMSGAAVVASCPEEASATYSAYAAREKDWEERKASGEIQYSTARDLRAQLREIVPQNSEGSKVFCPNGPSAAVSPLMENKCNDRLAMPSVYGRTSDITGNSIPGFSGGKYAPVGAGTITVGSGLDATGGFPTYKPY